MWQAASKSGFTLAGVLIALVLMGIGAATLASSSMFVLGIRTEASVRATATALAAAYLEEIKTRDLSTLSSEEPVSLNEAGQQDEIGAFVRILTVTPEESVEDTKRVIIEVRYRSGMGRMRAVQLETIIYHGSFQGSE
ncbi:MAG: type II secretion system protein [Gemmatimonadota bacterium]|nr:MAG: type II secretion system protein [Gemmatimonadota bacterium]